MEVRLDLLDKLHLISIQPAGLQTVNSALLAFVTELNVGQSREQGAKMLQLRQTETGRAEFIASSKNKTRKQTIVLSESDVSLSFVRGFCAALAMVTTN